MPGTDPWKSGADPTVKALRIIAVLSVLGLLAWWVIIDRDHDLGVGALLGGMLLAALFGDISIALPFFKREGKDDDTD